MEESEEVYKLFSKIYDDVQKYSKYEEFKSFTEEIWKNIT